NLIHAPRHTGGKAVQCRRALPRPDRRIKRSPRRCDRATTRQQLEKIPPANFFHARRVRRPSLRSDGDEGCAVKKIYRTRPLRADPARLPVERRQANLNSYNRDNNRSGASLHGSARKEICALYRARPVAAGGQTPFADFPTMNKP